MKSYEQTKFTIIGFGFLMGYIAPCYTQFFSPEALKEHVVAVTADETSLERKRAQYPFEILLNDNEKALNTMQPDIILFAPPPSVAPELAESVLKPYFERCRQEERQMPDLYVFPPSPQGDFYLDLLGEDIHVCNILPNMMSEINGVSLNGAEGNTHVTIPARAPWPEENKARLEQIFAPFGGVVYVAAEHVLDMLAALCVIEIVPLMLFDLSDATGLDSSVLASAMRAAHQVRFEYLPIGSTPCSMADAPQESAQLLAQIDVRWMDAMVGFLTGLGMEQETAEKILIANLDLKLHCCQLQPRAKSEDDLRNHATKGGVAERARMCYDLLLAPIFHEKFAELPKTLNDEMFFARCQSIAEEICRIVAMHSRRLHGGCEEIILAPDHAAMLFALFVRNASAIAGEAGTQAAHQGLLLYANQRGSRMAKRAAAHGDEATMLNYMVYGEWSPLPGTMEQENVALEPAVVTHVSKCPWYTVWNRLGFLKEGEEYCKYIDYNLVKGYNPELELGVSQVRTCGAPYCEFIWNGCALTQENAAYLNTRKAELGDSCKKDWLFHTRHTYGAMSQELQKLPEGEKIISDTMHDFETLYGAVVRQAVEKGREMDFYAV